MGKHQIEILFLFCSVVFLKWPGALSLQAAKQLPTFLTRTQTHVRQFICTAAA